MSVPLGGPLTPHKPWGRVVAVGDHALPEIGEAQLSGENPKKKNWFLAALFGTQTIALARDCSALEPPKICGPTLGLARLAQKKNWRAPKGVGAGDALSEGSIPTAPPTKILLPLGPFLPLFFAFWPRAKKKTSPPCVPRWASSLRHWPHNGREGPIPKNACRDCCSSFGPKGVGA